MLNNFFSIIIIIITLFLCYNFYQNKEEIKETQLIPRQVLFGNPDKIQLKVSPNGEYISYIAPLNGVLNVWIAPRDDIAQAKAITADTKRGIRQYIWGYDNQHILYTIDNDGDENHRIYSKNIITNNEILLTPANGVKAVPLQASYKFPDEVVIGINQRDPRFFDVYKYSISSGKSELLLENRRFNDVVVDENLQVRFAALINDQGNTEYFQLINNAWQAFIEVSLEDSTNTGVLGFNKTGNILYLSDSRNRNTAALTSIDLITGELSVIAKDEKSDVDIFTAHPTENTIQAISTNYEKEKYTILDPAIKNDLDYLSALSDGEINITSRSIDDKYWSIAIMSDDYPVKYYIYDRANQRATYLFTNFKALENYKLSKMHPVIIKSRDGLDLVSYITFPKNINIDQNLKPDTDPLPMILNVHGGPWVRDSWGFDPETQFLADRGYVVLNINYRGSTGFGKNFINAGNMQWGKKMHNDLIDGVNWAIANKIADPKKIVIMGGSYGGYAALAGLTLTPDVFAGAVDIVGPSNLITLVQNFPPYWTSFIKTMSKRIGPWDTEEGKENLLAVSPISHVDKIIKPLLIGQGANDPRVTQLESDQIVENMHKRNIPVVYALYSDEGHGFARPENRISFYALTEQFLADILGGKAELINNDLEGSNLILNGKKTISSAEAEEIIHSSIPKSN